MGVMHLKGRTRVACACFVPILLCSDGWLSLSLVAWFSMMTLPVSVNGEVWRHISRGSLRLLPSNQFHKEQQPLNLPSVKGEFSDGEGFHKLGNPTFSHPDSQLAGELWPLFKLPPAAKEECRQFIFSQNLLPLNSFS